MSGQLDQLINRVGGERNATIIVGAAGAGLVWVIGRRKNKKSQTAPVNVMAQGYADTAQDPTALYTGYDQLQQEIDNLRNVPGASSGDTTGGNSGQTGTPNPNPVPIPTQPAAPPPIAPTPAQLDEHFGQGMPLPSNAPTPQQIYGPAPSFGGGPPWRDFGGGGGIWKG